MQVKEKSKIQHDIEKTETGMRRSLLTGSEGIRLVEVRLVEDNAVSWNGQTLHLLALLLLWRCHLWVVRKGRLRLHLFFQLFNVDRGPIDV